MQNYNVFVDEMGGKSRSNSATTYKIALIPSSRAHGAMATKDYLTKEAFIGDLQRYFGYTGAAIERFLSEGHQTLMHQSLSDEDAAYLGWLPEFNR
jgi:hypothetical protein